MVFLPSYFKHYGKEVALPLVRQPPSRSALLRCTYSFSLKVKRRAGFYFTLEYAYFYDV